MRRLIPSVLLVGFAIFAGAAAAVPGTTADAQADFDAGQYRPALVKISQALSFSDAKDGPKRYDLFMLRGECLLRLKERSVAVDAFRSAARAMKDDGDVHKASAAAATAMLIESSRNLTFTPSSKTVGEVPKPIDIVPPDMRKQALAALFEQRLAVNKPKIDKALAENVLTPILDLLPALRELYILEDAATNGEAVQTIPILKSLGEHARKLIGNELHRISRWLNDLEDSLSEPVFLNLRNAQGVRTRGLSTNEQKELRDIDGYLTKIAKVAQQGRWINRRLGGTGEVWDTILADCSESRDDAQSLAQRR